MNIFVLDRDPSQAAAMLCDCHLRKMCVETAQILSGVMLRRGMPLLDDMPKPQNINHPVIVAADAASPTLDWVVNYNFSLHQEFKYRFDKPHAYLRISLKYIADLWYKATTGDCIHLAKCCGDLDVSDMDIGAAYRKYYTEIKKPQLQAKGLWQFTAREDWTK